MLLGKRPRPSMKRTTSLSEIISVDPCDSSDSHQPDHQQTNPTGARPKNPGSGGTRVDQQLFLETPHFLKSCGLCKRKLVPGRDIYMYRGDGAFCSLECRQQQMNQDERKDNNCSYAAASSSKKQAAAAAGGSQVSTKGETVAAAAV